MAQASFMHEGMLLDADSSDAQESALVARQFIGHHRIGSPGFVLSMER